jgi:Holliday junction resolvase RusA-like endonuclease
MYEVVVYHRPIGQARHRTAGGHNYTPTATLEAQRRLALAWQERYPDLGALTAPLVVEITVALTRPATHFGTGKNAGRLKPAAPAFPAGKPDWDNYGKLAGDALNGVAWRDDGQIVRGSVAKVYSADRPFWRILVLLASD